MKQRSEARKRVVVEIPFALEVCRECPLGDRAFWLFVVRLPTELFFVGQTSKVNDVSMDLPFLVDVVCLKMPRATAGNRTIFELELVTVRFISLKNLWPENAGLVSNGRSDFVK